MNSIDPREELFKVPEQKLIISSVVPVVFRVWWSILVVFFLGDLRALEKIPK